MRMPDVLDSPTPTPPPAGSDPSASPELVPMDPARSAYLQDQLRGILHTLLESMARADPMEAASTASERMMARVLRSQIPRLRDALSSRLSSTDPRGIERILGATATALEAILYYAPGTPEPRMRFEWITPPDGPPVLSLVPDESRGPSDA